MKVNKKDLKSTIMLRMMDQNKNFMVMKLLSYVPEFKKDVADIRKEMGIKEGGFEWDKSEMWKWADEKDLGYYQEARHEDKEEGTYYLGITSKSDNIVRKDFPSNFFEKKMSELGIKYKLPFNFYAFPCVGLPVFVLSGEISAPRSNYFTDFHEAGDKTMWISLVAYAPLSVKELKEASDELRDISMKILSEEFSGIDTLSKKRYHNKIFRDLSLFEEQVKREGKPKKVKKYEKWTYVDYLSKSKSTSVKILRQKERENKKDVSIEYSNLTSGQIGKKHGVTGVATRQAKKRLNSIAKELFGYDLEL